MPFKPPADAIAFKPPADALSVADTTPDEIISHGDPARVKQLTGVASHLSGIPWTGFGEQHIAKVIPAEDRELFSAIAAKQYAQDQTMKKAGYGTRLAASLTQGFIDTGMPLAKMAGKITKLDPEQERFKQRLTEIRQGIDPTISPETNILGRSLQQASQMAFPAVTAAAAGQVTGGLGGLAGLGKAGVGVATALGTSGVSLPQTVDSTYTSLIGEGVDPKTAWRITAVSAPIEAAIESILPDPFSGYGGAFKGTARQVAAKLIKQYAVNTGKELTEEGIQKIVNETAMEVGRRMDADIPDKGLGNILVSGLQEMRDTALPLSMMIAPGAAVGGAQVAQESNARAQELARLKALRTVNGSILKREAAKLGFDTENMSRQDLRGVITLKAKQLEQEIQNEVPPEETQGPEVRQAPSGQGQVPAVEVPVGGIPGGTQGNQPAGAEGETPQVPIDEDIMAKILADAEEAGHKASKRQSFADLNSPKPLPETDLQKQATAKGGEVLAQGPTDITIPSAKPKKRPVRKEVAAEPIPEQPKNMGKKPPESLPAAPRQELTSEPTKPVPVTPVEAPAAEKPVKRPVRKSEPIPKQPTNGYDFEKTFPTPTAAAQRELIPGHHYPIPDANDNESGEAPWFEEAAKEYRGHLTAAEQSLAEAEVVRTTGKRTGGKKPVRKPEVEIETLEDNAAESKSVAEGLVGEIGNIYGDQAAERFQQWATKESVPPVQPKEPAKAEVIPEPLPPVEEKKAAEAVPAKPSGSIKLKQDEYDLSELSDTALRHLSRKNSGTQAYVNSGDNIKTAVQKELANRKLEDTTKGPEGVGEEEMKRWTKAREEKEKAEQRVPMEHTTLNQLEESLFHLAANKLNIPHGRGKFGFSAAKQHEKAIANAMSIMKAAPERTEQTRKIEEAKQKAEYRKADAKNAEDEYYRVAGSGFPPVPPGVRFPLERGSAITVHEFDPARGKYRIESHGNESWVSPQPLLDNYASKEENDAVLLAEKTFSESQKAKQAKKDAASRKQREEEELARLKNARSAAKRIAPEKAIAKTNVKADVVLDSFDLGKQKGTEHLGLSTGGLAMVKTMAKEVPEFAYEPVFTVNAKKQLVFRDGITYTLNPEQFNLHPSELTEGQTVGINLEDIGLKQITASEAVAKVLKNNGFSNVKTGEKEVTASWKGLKVLLVGEGDQWEVKGHVHDGTQVAVELLRRIHFYKGGKSFQAKSSLQQKASAALTEANDALKSFVKEVGGTSPNTGANPKHFASAARVVGLYFKAGYYQFQAFLEALGESIGQASVDKIQPYLESAWDKAYESGEFEGMEPRVAPAKETPADSGETTGSKNAKTNEARARAGMEERPPVEPASVEQWQAEAAKRMKDPNYAPKLAEELAANPKALDPVEEAVMGRYLRDLENRRQAGEDVSDELRTAVVASERVGTVWGRTGVSRQTELAADFSVAGIVRQHLRSVNKAPTDAEMQKYSEMADRIAALEGELSDTQKKLAQAEIDKQIAEAKAASPQPAPKIKGGKRAQLKQKASDAVAKFKDKWAALYQLGIAPNPKEDAKKWAEITTAAVEVVKAYGELGIDSFLELMSRIKSDIGKITSDQKDAFKEAWDQYRAASKVEAPETPDNASLGALARRLTRWAVESGITKRDEVIDAVHQELTDMGFEVERSDTMAAMSGYGDFRELSKDEVSVKVRGIKGEIQQLLKLEDMQAGQAPAKTGVERRVPTEEERQLIKKVNEAKKKGGYVVTDPAKQLQSALGTAKTAAKHRITDLENAIAKREKIVAGQTKLAPDAELAALQKKRDELNEEYRKIFPPKKSVFSDAARLKAAEKMLDRHIAELKADLAAGKLDSAAKKPGLSSPEIEAKKLQLELLKEAREQARLADPEYQAKEQAKQNARYRASLDRQLALWQERLASGTIPEKRQQTPLDKEMLEKKFQIELVKREVRASVEEAERANRSATGKALGFGGDLLDLSQAIMTGFEMSAVLRQGAFYTLGMPRKALNAIKDSVRAAISRRADFALHDDLMNRPNHVDYMRGGLETTAADGPLSHREELIRSRLASWLAQQKGTAWALPRWAAEGLLGGERAFRTFANTMRADLFDYMKSSIEASRPGTWSEDDAKVVGNASNVFSGRGTLPASLSGVASARIFFAPRWVWSRGQLLVGQPLWKGDSATRMAVGKVYVRAALGFAGFQLIKHVLYSLLAGDDEEKPKYELDRRSTDFNKTRLGDTRIDSGAGLNQLIVLITRVATGEKKMASGKIVPIRGEDVPYGADDTGDILTRFLRSKLAPLPSGVIDWIVGENIVGEKTTVGKIVGERVTPMTWRDIWEAEKELNVPQGTVAAIEAFFGEGVTTYGKRTSYRNADEEGKKKLVFSAFENLGTKDNEKAATDLQSFGITLGEARTLLREYYLRTDSSGKRGSLRDKGTGDLKDSYVKKQRALARLFAE